MPLLLIAGVGVILSAFVAYAVANQSNYWGQAIAHWASGWLQTIPFIGGWLKKGALALANWISHELGTLALELERFPVAWLGGLAHWVKIVWQAAFWPATGLITVTRWLVGTKVPALIRQLTAWIAREAHAGVTIVKQAGKVIYKTVPLSRAAAAAAIAATFPGLVGALPAIRWLQKHWRALVALLAAAAVPVAGVLDWPRVRWRGERALEKRLGRVEKLLGVGAFAALMARVLHVSPGCLRNGNVGRAARWLCGLDSGLLAALIAGVVVLETPISLQQFARELVDIEGELAKLVLDVFEETKGLAA